MASAATHAAPAAPAAATAPFRAGTFEQLQSDGYANSVTLSAATQTWPNYNPSPNAYLRGVYLQVVSVASGNSANVAFKGDAPFNVIQSVTFQDANQKPIVGPFDGYTLMIVNKFGGYFNNGDPRANAQYSVTTGSGSTGGSFTFVLYVPLEISTRDTLGSLQNKSSSSTFQLLITANTESAVYSTNPSSAPAVTLTCFENGYVQPNPASTAGSPLAQSPPQLGTTQYWTRGTYNSLNGSQQIQLTQGLGYPVRNFAALNYDVSDSTRATGDTDFPTTFELLWKGTAVMNGVTKTLWKWNMSQQYGYFATSADAANGLENGVYVKCFCNDFSNEPGAELHNAYLATQQGDLMQAIATWNGNSTLYWLANYVAPAAGPTNVASIQAGR